VSQAKVELSILKSRTSNPPRAKVVLYNDDYTPMEFVVDVLGDVFHMPQGQATNTVLQVHNKGWSICGEFPRDIAETKAAQVVNIARVSGHPLFCQAKPA
jgi:ATP-dependent Clp protease adaptor protein ClpS